MLEEKIWGTDECIATANGVEVHLLRLRAKDGKPTCCSWHRHAYKHNSFSVIEGRIQVRWAHQKSREQYSSGDDPWVLQTLEAGDTVHIRPGCWHRFEIDGLATVVETVWAESVGPDIERADVGHVLGEQG